MSTSSDALSQPTTEEGVRVAGTFAAEPIGAVLGRLRLGELAAADELAAALARANAHGAPASARFGAEPVASDAVDPAWIDRFDDGALAAAVGQSVKAGPHAPLAGVPVAVKGNIDVAGLPTTGACPTLAGTPAAEHATAVQRLVDAGAIVVGTTNLDQFATGLNGTRSPYGAPHAVGLPGRISGGSSSGSAVAVARGDVALALGTDTAGSGRVPAALNGIVGFKPTKGLVSTAGLMPACRSLDVITVFTADVDSAALALSVLAGPDPSDAWSRTANGFVDGRGAAAGSEAPHALPLPPAAGTAGAGEGRTLRLGIPAELTGDAESVGVDEAVLDAWQAALGHASGLAEHVELVPVDLAPFYEAGALLYGGAFVAERHASVGALIERLAAVDPADPALDPTVREIVLAGAEPSAAAAFADLDRIRQLTAHAHAVLGTIDALFTPTVLEHPTHDELAADPIGANARLGRFTTFGNLLDLAVIALPSSPRADGLPFGISFHVPAFADGRALELGARFERVVRGTAEAGEDELLIAVGGAHMAGLPANGELLADGGRYLRLTRTAPDYRLHVLNTPLGPRPGFERVTAPGEGEAIEVELWAIPSASLGSFSSKVPPHLAVGPVTLLDGSSVLGFVGAASDEVAAARTVSSWRHFARGG